MAHGLAQWVTVNGTNSPLPFCTRSVTMLQIYADFLVRMNIQSLRPVVSGRKCSCTVILQDCNLHIPGLDLGLEVQPRK